MGIKNGQLHTCQWHCKILNTNHILFLLCLVSSNTAHWIAIMCTLRYQTFRIGQYFGRHLILCQWHCWLSVCYKPSSRVSKTHIPKISRFPCWTQHEQKLTAVAAAAVLVQNAIKLCPHCRHKPACRHLFQYLVFNTKPTWSRILIQIRTNSTYVDNY